MSPEGNPLPRHPEFEPLAGRPYLLPEKEDISFAGVAEWQTRQTEDLVPLWRMGSSPFARTISSEVERAVVAQW